mmetsp:Transcript_46737/g.150633  ORF Transcript_46737/g.150633 Transcript_46737/m.150633 type:complete len:256 (+) Transcript_46737:763-1530(+)
MAPAGSSIARVSSKQSRTAAQISSVETVTTSSTSESHSRKTSEPSCCTAAPSTKWDGSESFGRCPASSERCIKLFSSGSTPMTLVPGMSCLTMAATPAIREPPPVQTKIASSDWPVPGGRWPFARATASAAPRIACGAIPFEKRPVRLRARFCCMSGSRAAECCRTISRPQVALPEMTRTSSCRWQKTAPPSSRASRCASRFASSRPEPCITTFAPARSICERRWRGVRSGSTMVACMPSAEAATAREWPCPPTE